MRLVKIHSSIVLKVYSPLSIINHDREVKTFLEKTYSDYVANCERYQLDLGTIDAYLDAKAENDYLQLRGIKLVVAMEALKDVFLRIPQSPVQEYVPTSGSLRKKLTPEIEKSVRAILTNAKVENSVQDAVCEELNE